jgi:N-acetylglucosaminyldiphosphoundecaprenol N-acetyl-beta-D-mannosaminyltransferase
LGELWLLVGCVMAPRRVRFLADCPIDVVTLTEVGELAVAAIETGQRFQHSDINVAKLVSLLSNQELLRCLAASDIVCADGMGIVWGCRALGLPVRERVTGIDLMGRLIEAAALRGYRCYFLGARPEVLERAIANLQRQHPSLQIAGRHHGYFEPPEEEAIAAEIRSTAADILFVGMPTPKKELFLNRQRDTVRVPVQIGVGGAFDVVAGLVSRAPVWAQRIGLEWLVRLAQEPRRLAWRYLRSNLLYACLLACGIARSRLVPHPTQQEP